MAQSTTPRVHMGAELSHDLVPLGQSPYWDGPRRSDRWRAFIDAVERTGAATYADLPPKLKKIYDAAARMQSAAPR